MHVRRQVREAVKKRLIDAVAPLGGRVYLRHPGKLQGPEAPIAIVRSIEEPVEQEGDFANRWEKNTIRIAVIVFAEDFLTAAGDGQPVLAPGNDWESRCDAIIEEVEPALDPNGPPLVVEGIGPLNESDIRLLHRGPVRDTDTGEEPFGGVRLVYEIPVATVGSRPSETMAIG